jgi:hypothetical protein
MMFLEYRNRDHFFLRIYLISLLNYYKRQYIDALNKGGLEISRLFALCVIVIFYSHQ